MKILIIDDDADLLEMTSRRITRKGAEAVTASNLKEASDIIQKNPDLISIICDLFLHNGENGLTFYEQEIKNKFKGKFVLATGDGSADPKIEVYKKEDKLFYCVEKPYPIEEVLEFFNA